MSNTTAAAAPAINVPAEVVASVSGALGTNSVGQASIDFYVAALTQAGRDPESLSFAEIVEVTRRLYAPSADYRRTQADVAKAEREAAKEIARAKREEERKARLLAEAAALKAKLAKLEGK